MHPFSIRFFATGFLAISLVAASCAAGAEVGEATKVTEREAEGLNRAAFQILTERCSRCHGTEKREAGLRLDDRAEALRGGDSGEVIAPEM